MTKSKANRKSKPAKSAAAPSPAETPGLPSDSFLIVGVGASAGGLEAFIELLKALHPKLGMALVLIPHLDPTHESAMKELLSRATKMPVLQVEHGMRTEPDHVYVIPPGCEMTIKKGVLQLAARRLQQPPMPIDIFLRSLAEDQRNNAVGIILSGTAS